MSSNETFGQWLNKQSFERLTQPSNELFGQWLDELGPAKAGPILGRLYYFYWLTGDAVVPPEYLSTDIFFDLPVPDCFFTEALMTLKVLPDKDFQCTPKVARDFLEALRVTDHPLSFEVVRSPETMHIRLSFPTRHRELVERALKTHYPHFGVVEDATLAATTSRGARQEFFLQELRQEKTQGFTRMLPDFALEPYKYLFEVLETAAPSDTVCYQVLFTPVPHASLQMITYELDGNRRDWNALIGQFTWEGERRNKNLGVLTRGLNRLWGKRGGNHYIVDEAGDMLEKKIPAWIVSVRLFSTSRAVLDSVQRECLTRYKTPDQTLVSSDIRRVDGIDRNMAHLSVVSTDELAALAHFPTAKGLPRRFETTSRQGTCPATFASGKGAAIGQADVRGKKAGVWLPENIRDRHVYVIGKTRTGKSTLILNLARQDIESGKGVALVDPHGDLAQDLLKYVPQSRIADTIYFDAADKDHPIPLNVLSAKTPEEVGILAEDLVVTFRRLSESWGERMEAILRYAFHTLSRTPGATLLDLRKLLANRDWRESVVARLADPVLAEFWREEFPKLPKEAAQPILARLSKFMLSPALSGILGAPKSVLNFSDLIAERKVLLVNLGRLGEDEQKLLGSILISQIQLAIMRRAGLAKENRHPFYLYVDEFQNFTTSAFEKIFSEAGKYRLFLTLAHQFVSQLDERLRRAIIGNVGTTILFSLGKDDAAFFKSEIGEFTPEDLTSLNPLAFEALVRPLRAADTFKLTTLAAPPPPTPHFAGEIIEHTRAHYSISGMRELEVRRVPLPPAPPDGTPKEKEAAPEEPSPLRTNLEKILSYVTCAEYLATSHIQELVYPDLKENSRVAACSRDLRKLVGAKKIHVLPLRIRKQRIYAASPNAKPTPHNLAVRDMFVKIERSGYRTGSVTFAPKFPVLTPDLAVTLISRDGSRIETLWEYDAGTEGIETILDKVRRYTALGPTPRVTFVLTDLRRLFELLALIKEPRVTLAETGAFSRLQDPAFWRSGAKEPRPFFDGAGDAETESERVA